MPTGALPASLRDGNADFAHSSRGSVLDSARCRRSLRPLQRRVFEAVEAAASTGGGATSITRRWSWSWTAIATRSKSPPSPDDDEASRGVVASGAVGSRHAGWLRLFRYEVRCWRGGSIPDLGEALGGPRRLTGDPRVARRLLDLVASVPTPVWGRDEMNAGEMWNSNSMIAWLIATTGLPTDLLRPPPGGCAPGWDAGLRVARRSKTCERGHSGAWPGTAGRAAA